MRRLIVLLALILMFILTPISLHAGELAYSTFLGGSGGQSFGDLAYAIAVDSAGCAYVAGWTYSADFPTTAGAFQTLFKSTSYGNAFVTKLNSAGTSLVYSTFLGGSIADAATAIAVDSAGCAYVAGWTSSPDFPTTTDAFRTSLQGTQNAFITKLDSSGSSLNYSSFLGGSNYDSASAIALDSVDCAYVAGQTQSSDFPTTLGTFQTALKSLNGNGFVTKLNPSGSSLIYSTFLGGSTYDWTNAIAVDAADCAYVVGEAQSTDFPTTPGAFQTSLGNPNGNGFVTKLSGTGSSLLYSTFIGGSGNPNYGDEANAVAVDSNGCAYIAGQTGYPADFPTTLDAFQTTLNSPDWGNAFVTKLNSTGSSLVYSTYLGGSGYNGDSANAIALDSADCAYVAGLAQSTDFPTTLGAFQTSLNSLYGNAFATKLSSTGSSLVYSTFLGGSGGDEAYAIAVDSAHYAYVAGATWSADFPTTLGAFQTTLKSPNGNAFVSKLNIGASILAGLASNGSIWCTSDLNTWSQIPGSLSSLMIGNFTDNEPYGFAGLDSDGSIWYTVDLTNWINIPGQLSSLVAGDFAGNGIEGLAGLAQNGGVWYTADLQNWKNVPGSLNVLTAGNFAGSGAWGLAGISSNGNVWISLDLLTWSNIGGQLSTVIPGDFSGNGKEGIAGLGFDGTIRYTSDLVNWSAISGQLSSLVVGDFNGDGKADMAGLASDGSIWYTTDLATWINIPGYLASLTLGDFNGDGKDGLTGLSSDGGIWYTTDLQHWTQIPGQLSILVSRGNQP